MVNHVNDPFETFDPMTLASKGGNWMVIFMAFWSLPPIFWQCSPVLHVFTKAPLTYVANELRAVISRLTVPGFLLNFVALFIFIAVINVIGLLPYVFTGSRHVIFTVALALPIWLGHMLFGATSTPTNVLAHFVPLGTPAPLIPFMVLIELTRRLIRPLTLSVRLAANMIAGHLLLALLGGVPATAGWISAVLVLSALLLLLLLERAVALIQAYVFSVLSTLYVEEVNSEELL